MTLRMLRLMALVVAWGTVTVMVLVIGQAVATERWGLLLGAASFCVGVVAGFIRLAMGWLAEDAQ